MAKGAEGLISSVWAQLIELRGFSNLTCAWSCDWLCAHATVDSKVCLSFPGSAGGPSLGCHAGRHCWFPDFWECEAKSFK